jgi:serine/threonine protein kinase
MLLLPEGNTNYPVWFVMASEYIGRVIHGRYRLISRLAEGGMGVTYRAWDLRAGAPVVLKMPKQSRGDADGSEFKRIAERFVREIETMRALSHDYIVPILDHGDDDGLPFVVMRFLPGGSLADHRKRSAGGDYQPLPASMLHNWLPSIADALDFIHSRGILHRDVKPANIFFDGFRIPFLGDFGIAKVVDEGAGLEKGQTLTATHLAIGTPDYMAPELLSPKTMADGRADQYALAICVYELLDGRRPFTGAKAHIVIEHATLPVPPLDRQSLGLPANMAAAVEKALSKKPDERFGSCHEFARAVLADVSMQPYEPDVVRLLCPGCHKVLKVPRRAGGSRGNCPSCREFVEIASDFSALWLKSEAALLAEPSEITPAPTPFGSSRLLGELDTNPEVASGVGGLTEEAATQATGQVFVIGGVIAATGLFGLLVGMIGLAPIILADLLVEEGAGYSSGGKFFFFMAAVNGLLVAMAVLGIEAIRLSHTRMALAAHVMSRAAAVLAIALLLPSYLTFLPYEKKLFDDFGSELPAVTQLTVNLFTALLTRWGLVLVAWYFTGFFFVEAFFFRALHRRNARSRFLVRLQSAVITSLLACGIFLAIQGLFLPIIQLISDLA